MVNSQKTPGKQTTLSILLTGAFLLSAAAFIVNFTAFFYTKILNENPYNGDNPLIVLCFPTTFLILIWLSKKGYKKFSSIALIYIFYLGATYTSVRWGADVPQALLIYAVDIVLTGILLNSKFAIVQTMIISVTILVLSYLQNTHIVQYNNYWYNEPPGLFEAITASISLFIITIASWLSNREIERSLERAETSERALKKERDMLEQLVTDRTVQVQQIQLEKITQLYRFADFGRLTSGLMHDLVNPLTSVSLNIDHMVSHKKSFKAAIKRAQTGIKRMEKYVEAARKQVQQQEGRKTFSLRQELIQIISIFSYRQKTEHIRVKLNIKRDIKTFSNPIAFNQAISNILANAFDAYEEYPTYNKKPKEILIQTHSEKNTIIITIQDWGKGIERSTLPHIFDAFFTTKNIDKGTGIGLSISKKAIEEKLQGTITVRSSQNEGTVFTITLPLVRKVDNI